MLLSKLTLKYDLVLLLLEHAPVASLVLLSRMIIVVAVCGRKVRIVADCLFDSVKLQFIS